MLDGGGTQSFIEAISRVSASGTWIGILLIVGGIPVAAALIIGLLRNYFARS
jgi:hypothetical protein